jgi:DNA (cytosine-5)-methyltransferase 1
MKFISMFSGIEAATVASKDLGWEPVSFSEIEPFPSAVLAHHYPHVPNVGDMTKVDWSKYHGTVDLVCGGSPCQAFSIAGLRGSLGDDRGNLTLEFMRACHAIKPRWIMWENVPGVFSAKGNPFGCFLAGLAGYDAAIEPSGGKWSSGGFLRAANSEGYSCAWRVLDAQYFGVPQRRQRVFLVASLGEDWWAPCEILLEREGVRGNTAESGEARKEVAGDAGSGAAGTVYHDRRRDSITGPLDVCPTLESQMGTGGGNVPLTVCSIQGNLIGRDKGGPCGVGVAEDAPMYTLTSADQHAVCHGIIDRAAFNQGENVLYEPKTEETDTVPTIVARGPHARFYDRQSTSEYGTNEVASTVQARDFKGPTDLVTAFKVRCGKEGGGKGYLGSEDKAFTLSTGHDQDIHYSTVVRRLTEKECERLQGFPDDYTLIPWRGKMAASAPRYKALGNSWAVPCARWIFERIAKLELDL